MMIKKQLIIILTLFCFSIVNAQLKEYSYWFDSNYQERKTVSVNGNLIEISNIDASTLNPGLHRMHIQAESSVNESSQNEIPYSTISTDWFYKTPIGQIRIDYWFDSDLDNLKTHILNVENNQNATFSDSIDISNLSDGVHRIFYRLTKGGYELGNMQYDYFIKNNSPYSAFIGEQFIIGYEYWFNENLSEAVEIIINPTKEFELSDNIKVPTNLGVGEHIFNIRFKDNLGQWSDIYKSIFEVIKINTFNEYLISNNIKIEQTTNAISIETTNKLSVTIYNLSGQSVFSDNIIGNTVIQLEKGVYIIQIENCTYKIIVD